ncbi:MAG: PTS sugar transporter subunit IIC [Clostridia bacterium]|nr:PTS sugar transporter subunit IIC [Clostridia bacterium]
MKKERIYVMKFLKRLFIDGLSGMALGLFATLIIGTILKQIGAYIPGIIGSYLIVIGQAASILTGAGIGVGVAVKLQKKAPLLVVGAAVAGFIGSYAGAILKGTFYAGGAVNITGVGEPLGAFVAAYVAIELGGLVSGKTPVDIIVTPLVSILSGSLVGLLLGPPISSFMLWLGNLVNINVDAHPIMGGIIVSVLMGIFLTLPISSAAIGITMGLSGLAAGAATVGCCANMIGFAVISYRENKFGGLVAQGLGTSMLQMPNIVKKPIIWLPAILTSAILGPLSTTLGMISDKMGSGMGTAGLVGPIQAFSAMTAKNVLGQAAFSPFGALVLILLMHFVLPAIISLFFAEVMRKMKLIKSGDMRLDL